MQFAIFFSKQLRYAPAFTETLVSILNLQKNKPLFFAFNLCKLRMEIEGGNY